MNENEAPNRNSTGGLQNQPRRQRFLFEGMDQINYQRNQQLNDTRAEKSLQFSLETPSDFKEAFINIAEQVATLLTELKEALYEIPSNNQVCSTIKSNLTNN